jgi:hypothetical protein
MQPAAARCQLGHEIAPGASYCPQGHPIALDQMQFAHDAYASAYAQQGMQPGFGAPPQPAYGAPPQAPPGQAFGPPPGQPMPQGGYSPAGGYGAPMPPGYGPPNAGYPQPPPPQPGYGGPPQGYAPPAQSPGFGPPGPPVQAYSGIPGAPPPAPYGGASDTARDAAPPKILRGFLVAYGSNPNGDFWPLTGGRLTVGRLGGAEGIDISLQDPTISSRHAAMVVDAASGSITVEDTGSTNGTFVNDEHIGFNGRRDLRDGDRLRFGGFSTIVKLIGRF